MRKFKYFFRTILFIIILAFFVFKVQEVFKTGQNRTYQAIEGFYREQPGSLDAVYIGASNVHFFWQPPLAWRDHGIAVCSYSVDALPMRAVKYLIAEARKTQPDALYIVNINSIKYDESEYSEAHIQRVSNYLHFSGNKINLINALADDQDIALADRLEFLFPIIRFHSRWSTLSSWDFEHDVNGVKMGPNIPPYWKDIKDISPWYYTSDKATAPTGRELDIIEDLLDYCDAQNLNVLFVTVPQAVDSLENCEALNGIEEYITSRNYKCLDILEIADEIGIKTKTDFYNKHHTNIHGSLKFTEYLSEYLINTYGFKDKRGESGWESWDAAAAEYSKIVERYALPFEQEHAPRDYNLSVPELTELTVEDQSITIKWAATEDAAGYDIFRKINYYGKWICVDSVDAGINVFTQDNLKNDTKYTYIVVPYRLDGQEKCYGQCDLMGISGNVGAEE